jgi:hypothetical protein
MQQQTLTVAIIVIVTFSAGFFTGRASVDNRPTPGVGAASEPSAPNAPVATPFPSGGSGSSASPAPFAPLAGAAAAPSTSAAALAGENVSGTIAELIQVPNFTYLRLSSSRGDEWAAISANTALKVGQQVTIGHAMLMQQFASKTLNRTFEQIWFGELAN